MMIFFYASRVDASYRFLNHCPWEYRKHFQLLFACFFADFAKIPLSVLTFKFAGRRSWMMTGLRSRSALRGKPNKFRSNLMFLLARHKKRVIIKLMKY